MGVRGLQFEAMLEALAFTSRLKGHYNAKNTIKFNKFRKRFRNRRSKVGIVGLPN